MKRRFLTWLHDSSFWSDYRAKIPPAIASIGIAGGATMLGSIRLRRSGHGLAAHVSLLVGLLSVVPAVAVGVLVSVVRRNRSMIQAQVLDSIEWSPSAAVLDVGCGTGMLLNGAARRVPLGRAVGIDIWDVHAGGGTLEVLMANARAEGVADRIEFRYADARELPFADGLFDAVLCGGAIHHIVRDRADLQRLLDEMVRVLKPAGRLVMWDVPHMLDASQPLLAERGVVSDVADALPFLGFENRILVGTKALSASG